MLENSNYIQKRSFIAVMDLCYNVSLLYESVHKFIGLHRRETLLLIHNALLLSKISSNTCTIIFLNFCTQSDLDAHHLPFTNGIWRLRPSWVSKILGHFFYV